MNDKLYKQKDLIDQCTVKNYNAVDGYGREAMLKACLPDRAELHVQEQGSHSGEISFIIELDDEIWLHNDYFGSCSHCDSFIANEKNWTEKMLRKAYCFDDTEDAIQYIETTEDSSWKGSYHNIAKPTLDKLEEIKNE